MIDQDKPQHCGSGGREVCTAIRGSAVRSPSTCSLHVDVSFGKIINPSLFLMDGFGWMDGWMEYWLVLWGASRGKPCVLTFMWTKQLLRNNPRILTNSSRHQPGLQIPQSHQWRLGGWTVSVSGTRALVVDPLSCVGREVGSLWIWLPRDVLYVGALSSSLRSLGYSCLAGGSSKFPWGCW